MPLGSVTAYIINLEADGDRLSAMLRQTEKFGAIRTAVVTAIRGDAVPESVRRVLAQDANWAKFKGTLGCFLSHVKAWEAFLNSGEPYGIILEDDVELVALERLFALEIPEDADIIFLND